MFWQAVEGGQEEPALLNMYPADLAERGVEITPDGSGQGKLNGHPLALRTMELSVERESLLAISGAWICEDRLFADTYATAEEVASEALQDAFQRYLAGLSCH